MRNARKFSGREGVFKRPRGASALGCLFFLVVIGAVGYAGVKVVPVQGDPVSMQRLSTASTSTPLELAMDSDSEEGSGSGDDENAVEAGENGV